MTEIYDLEACRKDENELKFAYFNNETALELGQIILKNAKAKGAAVVIDIELNDVQIFHYTMPGANLRQNMWVKKKQNTVRMAQMSSLRAGMTLEAEHKDLWKDWRVSDADYATIGGGFPIYVENCGIIGAIAVSGLPHTNDHLLICESIREYLNK